MLWADSPARAWEDGARTILYAGLATAALATGLRVRQAQALGWIIVGGVCLLGALTVIALWVDPAGYLVAGRLERPVGHASGTAAFFALAIWPCIAAAASRDLRVALRSVSYGGAGLTIGLGVLAQSRGVVLGVVTGGAIALSLGPERLRRAWLAVIAVLATAACSGWLLDPYRVYGQGGDLTATDIASAANAVAGLAVGLAFVGAALALIELRLGEAQRSRLRVAAARALAACAVGAILALALLGDPIGYAADRFEEFRSLQSISSDTSRFASLGGQRYDLWRVALDEFASQPVTGVGAGGYPFDYYELRKTVRNTSDPHSLPLRLLAETGLVGGALFACFVASLGWAGGAAWRTASPGAKRSASAFGAGGLVVVGHALVEWLWLIPGVMGPGLLLLTLAVAALERPRPRAGRGQSPLAILSAAGLLAAAAIVAVLYLSDSHLRRARIEPTPAGRLLQAQRAEAMNPWSVPARYLQASALESKGRHDAARALLRDALELEPRNFTTLGLMGDLEVRAGDASRARSYYSRALALNPRDEGLQALVRR